MVSPYSQTRSMPRRPVVPPEYQQAGQAPSRAPAVAPLPVAPLGPQNTSDAPTGVPGRVSTALPRNAGAAVGPVTSSLGNALGYGRPGAPADPNQAATQAPTGHAAYHSTWKYSHLVNGSPGTARTTGTAAPLPQQKQVLPSPTVQIAPGQGFEDPNVPGAKAPDQSGDAQGKGVGQPAPPKSPYGHSSQGLTAEGAAPGPGKIDNIPQGSTRYTDSSNPGGTSVDGYELWKSPDGTIYERRDDGYYPYTRPADGQATPDPDLDTLKKYGPKGVIFRHNPETGVIEVQGEGNNRWDPVDHQQYQDWLTKAKAAQQTAEHLAADNQSFEDWIKQMIGTASQGSGLDQKTIDDQIAAAQKRQAFEQSKGLSSSLALAQRSGMSTEGAGALGADINREFATRGQQQEADIRMKGAMANLQVKLQNIQQVMQALQMAAQNAATKEQHDMAMQSQQQLMNLQAEYQKEMMRYQQQMQSMDAGDAIGGLFGGLLGSIWSPISAGIGGAISKRLFG